MHKGAMRLIDERHAAAIYDSMGPAIEVSGGSAANTIVGVASLGARAAFIGKVKDDELGRVFAHDIRAAGVAFSTPPASAGPSTGRCYVLVTPDGERTMNTFLGAAQDLHPNDIDAETIASAEITYLEGYLWDPPHAKQAFLKAAGFAHAAGRAVALTLSDAFCVDRYRAEFLDLMRGATVDIVFANEHELHSLYQTADLDSAVNALREDVRLGVVTRSEKGCLVVTREETVAIQAYPVERLVDATGAGDLFAAGFLVGSARGSDHRTAARLGALVAAEVIQHMGARPEASLRTLAEQNGFEL
jgi:adenosine kinase